MSRLQRAYTLRPADSRDRRRAASPGDAEADGWLLAAGDAGSELAAQLLEAQTRLDLKDAAGALAAIEAAKTIAPQHTTVLRLELKARQLTGQWDEVDRVLDALSRSNALEPPIAAQLRRIAYAENLKRRADDDRALLEYWKRIPADFISSHARR